jgi:hypothetical protein
MASSRVIFLAPFAVAKSIPANALARFLFVREALLGATVLWTRRCVHKLPTLKHHFADLRFDMEDEEDTNDNSKLYGFLMQSAIDQ